MRDSIKKKANNKAWYERNKKSILAGLRSRYSKDTEFSRKIKERVMARSKADPEETRKRKREEKEKHPIRYSLYWRWKNMMGRCEDPKNKDYKNYGGRGIFVSRPLKDFNTYREYVENLPKPRGFEYTQKFHLDRVDNDRGYDIGNLRWVTVKENLENSRNSKNNPTIKRSKI